MAHSWGPGHPVTDVRLEERLELARQRAPAIGWTPPLRTDYVPILSRPLVAEAVRDRVLAVLPALRQAELWGCAHVASRLEHMLARIASTPVEWLVEDL